MASTEKPQVKNNVQDKVKDLEKEIVTIELDRDGLFFISRAKNANAWVYVDAIDRHVAIFSDLLSALRHGLNNEIVDVEIVERKSENFYDKQYVWFKVKICTVDDCDTYRAWWE